MIRRKKNGLLTFCFSLLPGAGEMYLGFMKMGTSLMGMFFALIAVSSVLNIGPLMFIMPVVWCYSFFHLHNLAGLSDAMFVNVQDEYLFNLDCFFNLDKNNMQKYRKAIAAILIIIGALMLWNGFMDMCYAYLPDAIVRALRHIGYTIPQILVGLAIIAGGFYMIKGKKKALEEVIIDVTPEDNPVKKEKSDMEDETREEGNKYGAEADYKNS